MRPKHQTIIMLAAFAVLAVATLILLARMGCEPSKATAYLGSCAPTDTLHWHYAVNDSQPSPQNPTTVVAYFYMNGTLYDSTGMSGSTVRYWFTRPGRVNGKVNASSGGTTYGFGEVLYKTTIQGLTIVTSDSWTVDSLHTADGNIRNLDGSVSAAKTLTTTERQAIRDTIYHDYPTRSAGYSDLAESLWIGYVTRVVTGIPAGTLTVDERMAIRDTVWKDGRADTVGIHVWNVATKAVTSIPAATLTGAGSDSVGVHVWNNPTRTLTSIAAVTLTEGERQAIRDSTWLSARADNNRNAQAESVWVAYATRTLTASPFTSTNAALIADSLVAHAIGDSTMEGYLLFLGTTVSGVPQLTDTVYAIAVNMVDCDTVVCSTVVDTVFAYAELDTMVYELVRRMVGLTNENYYMDDLEFTGGLMTSARIRLYSSAENVGTEYDVIATYRITAEYEGNNLLTYKVVRE